MAIMSIDPHTLLEEKTIHWVEIFSPTNTFDGMIKTHALRCKWIRTNIKGNWFHGQNWCNNKWSWIYKFENEEDAVAFKLKWA